ncbi:MAG: YdcF family protein, partial [Halanaerobium sp.]
VLLHPLENYAEEISVNPFERHPIVVLGGGLNYQTKEKAAPSLHSMQRLVKGYQLHRRLKTPVIYSGGVAIGQEKISEADAAAEFLETLGMEREFYISEDQAQTTFENAAYLKKWIAENEVEKVYLVTSAYHILRSAAVFEAQDIDFLAVHSGFIYDHQFSWLDYLPNRGALTANLSALHEWVGLFWYYLRGRI